MEEEAGDGGIIDFSLSGIDLGSRESLNVVRLKAWVTSRIKNATLRI